MIAGRYDVDIPPPGRDEIGTMAQTLALFRDSIAERARLEEEAERQRRTLRTAIETISEGFALSIRTTSWWSRTAAIARCIRASRT